MAIEPELVVLEMAKLFADIEALLATALTLNETMYYAAYIHFVFAKIHPFADGNGRAARLLEKWFLAEVIGNTAWSIPSEKYYYDKRQDYYNALNVGKTYQEALADNTKLLPFFNLLTQAVSYKPVD